MDSIVHGRTVVLTRLRSILRTPFLIYCRKHSMNAKLSDFFVNKSLDDLKANHFEKVVENWVSRSFSFSHELCCLAPRQLDQKRSSIPRQVISTNRQILLKAAHSSGTTQLSNNQGWYRTSIRLQQGLTLLSLHKRLKRQHHTCKVAWARCNEWLLRRLNHQQKLVQRQPHPSTSN